VIYDHNWLALILPGLVWLGGVGQLHSTHFVSSIIRNSLLTASGILLLISVTHSDNSFYAQRSVNISIAFWSISMGLNVILTIFIVGRLLYARYRIKSSLGSRYGQNYLSVASMLVESAALYSIWALVFLITYARGSAAQNILLPPLGQIQVCGINSLLYTSIDSICCS